VPRATVLITGSSRNFLPFSSAFFFLLTSYTYLPHPNLLFKHPKTRACHVRSVHGSDQGHARLHFFSSLNPSLSLSPSLSFSLWLSAFQSYESWFFLSFRDPISVMPLLRRDDRNDQAFEHRLRSIPFILDGDVKVSISIPRSPWQLNLQLDWLYRSIQSCKC